jgi:hypothetical protein
MPRRLALLLIFLPLLAACGNAPEQPSDTPERQPDLLSDEEGGEDAGNGEGDGDGEEVIAPIPQPEGSEPADPSMVVGDWAGDQAACSDPAGAPVRITTTRFESPTDACDIGDLVDNGNGFTASMTCEAEGGTNASLVKLTPEDDTLTLSWVGRDDPEMVLERCE